ncbi:hypothetical protein JCGZ_16359 [Jatropha curcas]|uniref:Uncharacterized protein n=1 Tax=Jatropha curcas TaxID=180498 RepID=A0A067L7T5_JATCU|nr:putative UPF0481 protein At3g02645 [Jatropha curcas]KDP44526.1 hypothetical protein JCGZ_16359 [Jatropha curcas]
MEYKHLLDLQRNLILSRSEDANRGFLAIPCVTDLLKAGIDFAVGETEALVKITFRNGILTVPPLLVLENAESLIRNLVVYEQCDKSLRAKITGYFAFLDNLIKSSEDVEYLREK